MSTKQAKNPKKVSAPAESAAKPATSTDSMAVEVPKEKSEKVKTIASDLALNAVKGLIAFEHKRRNEARSESTNKKQKAKLFEDEYTISLQIGLKKIPEHPSNMPILIPLAHSLYNHEGIEMCLISKDPQSDIQQRLEEEPVERLTEVIGLTKLRKNYHQFEDKRELCQRYQLFVADQRILPMLPPLLGKYFFDRKKQPVAVKLGKNSMRSNLERVRDSTQLFITAGPTCQIKIGSHRLSASENAANVMTSLPHIVEHLPGKWKNIQSISIKTADSISIPLWNAVEPENGLQTVKLSALPAFSSEPVAAKSAAVSKPVAKPVAQPVAVTTKPVEPKKKEEPAKKTVDSKKLDAKSDSKKSAEPSAAKAKSTEPEPEIEDDEDDEDGIDLEDLDDESFEQLLKESGLEMPDDEDDVDMDDEDEDDEEEEEVPAPKGKKSAAPAKSQKSSKAVEDKSKKSGAAQVSRSSVTAGAASAREKIAERPKSKVAAAKASAKSTKTASKK